MPPQGERTRRERRAPGSNPAEVEGGVGSFWGTLGLLGAHPGEFCLIFELLELEKQHEQQLSALERQHDQETAALERAQDKEVTALERRHEEEWSAQYNRM